MKTKQDIIDEILASRLTAFDIHLFSERMIPMTQCHDLLRSGKMSIPTALLLRGYAARVGSGVVDEKKKSLDNLVVPEQVADIHDDNSGAEPDISVKADLPEKKLAAKKAVKEIKKDIPSIRTASEIPAKTLIEGKYSGRSGDADMTYIRKPTFIKVTLAGCRWEVPLGVGRFVVQGVEYALSDFKLSSGD